MKKQTAVEWLTEQMDFFFSQAQKEQTTHLFQLAKAMEKEQITQAVYDSMGTNFDPNMGRAEQYYNHVYGK